MEQNVRPYKHLRGTKILDIETAKNAGFEEGEIAITHGVSGDSRLYVLSQDGNSIDTFISQTHIENLLLEIEEVASSSLNDLNTRLNTVSGDVATNKELLSEHELISISAISTLSGSVVNNKDNISVLNGSVVNNKDNISALSGSVVNNINDILTLSGSVVTLSTSNISALSGSVINVKNDLSTLSGSVVNNKNDMSTLSGSVVNSIDEIEKVTAASLNDLNTRLNTVADDSEIYNVYKQLDGTLNEKTFKILYKYMFTPFIVNSNGTTTIPDELINDSGTNFITEYYWNYMRLTGGEPIVTTTWNGGIPLKFKGLLNGKTYSIDYTTKTITVEA